MRRIMIILVFSISSSIVFVQEKPENSSTTKKTSRNGRDIPSKRILENRKNKTFNLLLNVMTTIGIYDLHFSIGPFERVTTPLIGLRPEKLIYEGQSP